MVDFPCLADDITVPTHFTKLRWGVYGLCTIIISLMLAMCFAWWLGCVPFDSNFLWSINSAYCINYDIFRWRKSPKNSPFY